MLRRACSEELARSRTALLSPAGGWLPFPSRRVKRMRLEPLQPAPLSVAPRWINAAVQFVKGTWIFSPDIQGVNVLGWALAIESHASRVAALMERIPHFDKSALDLCGKWPLALSAAACGVRQEICFIDAAQSGGIAGADDGLFCTRGGGVVPFEVCACSAESR